MDSRDALHQRFFPKRPLVNHQTITHTKDITFRTCNQTEAGKLHMGVSKK